MAKKLKEETQKSMDEAEQAAEVSGTPSPVLEPEKANTPTPGTTPDLDVMVTDDAQSLNPNIVQSGTKPDGEGGQVLLDVVDPAVANAALLPRAVSVKPQSPSDAPEQGAPSIDDGQVLFRVTADNEPFYSGGPLKKGQSYVMDKEEADLLVGLNAGQIETGNTPPEAKPEEGPDRA